MRLSWCVSPLYAFVLVCFTLGLYNWNYPLVVTYHTGCLKKKENPLLKFYHGCKNWARNSKISANVLQHLFYQLPNFYLFPFDIFYLTAAHRQGPNIFWIQTENKRLLPLFWKFFTTPNFVLETQIFQEMFNNTFSIVVKIVINF